MSVVLNRADFDEVLMNQALVLAYFSGDNCNVCQSLKPKVKALIEQEFPQVQFVEVKTEQAMELASEYRVFSVPVVMFFADGREYIRQARNISIQELSEKIDKIVSLYNN